MFGIRFNISHKLRPGDRLLTFVAPLSTIVMAQWKVSSRMLLIFGVVILGLAGLAHAVVSPNDFVHGAVYVRASVLTGGLFHIDFFPSLLCSQRISIDVLLLPH